MPNKRSSLQQLVAQFFEDDDWPATWSDTDAALLQVAYQGNNGVWRCAGRVHDPEQQFVFYSIAPVTVDGEYIVAVAEYLNRANDGTVIGNFELSWDRGEVRYRTSIDVEGGELTQTMWRNLVYANVRAMDQYLPGLMNVANGAQNPGEAVAQADA